MKVGETPANQNYPSPPENEPSHEPIINDNVMMGETFYDNEQPESSSDRGIGEHFSNFSSKLSGDSSQMRFIRKILGIFSSQIVVSLLLNIMIMNSPSLTRISFTIFPLCIIGLIVTVIMIQCYDKYARTVPTNYILLGIATFCESILLANVVRYYPKEIIMNAAFLTIGKSSSQTHFNPPSNVHWTLYLRHEDEGRLHNHGRYGLDFNQLQYRPIRSSDVRQNSSLDDCLLYHWSDARQFVYPL